MVKRIIPEEVATVGRTAEAQVNINPAAAHSKMASMFSGFANDAQNEADVAAQAAAQEKAAQDLQQNPDGVPSLMPGQTITSQAYNTTAKNLYAVRADTQIQMQLNQLAQQHKDSPASFAQLSREFLDSWAAQLNQVDPAMAIKARGKYDLLVSNIMPELQFNADEKLLGEIKEGHAQSNQVLGQTIQSHVSRLYDKNDDGTALSSIGVMLADFETQLRTSLNPHDGTLLKTSSEVDAIMKEKWSYVTEEGLFSQIPKLSDEELTTWSDTILSDSFEAKFHVPETGSINIPLSAVMESERRRMLLGSVEQEQRQRNSSSQKESFAQQVAIENMMKDHQAQAKNTGQVLNQFSSETAEVLGLTAKQFVAYTDGILQNATQFHTEHTVAGMSPVDELMAENALRQGTEVGGEQAHEFDVSATSFESARILKENALFGDDNGVEYIIKFDPEVRDKLKGNLNGELPFEEYANSIDQYYARNSVPTTKRDYLIQEQVNMWVAQIPRTQDFDLNPKPDEPHYSGALLGVVEELQRTYGNRVPAVLAQLDKTGTVPKKTLDIFRIPASNVNARINFAQAISEEAEFKTILGITKTNEIKDAVSGQMADFMQSIPQGQDGKLRMLGQYNEAMALQAQFYVVNEGMDTEDAVERATEDFIGAFDLIPSSRGGVPSFVRITAENEAERSAMVQGVDALNKSLSRISNSAFNLFPQQSGFVQKEHQSAEDLKTAFEQGVRNQGVWRTSSDGTHVKLFYRGVPVHTVGDNGGVREIEVPIEMLSGLHVQHFTFAARGFIPQNQSTKMSDVIEEDKMVNYVNSRQPVMYIDSEGNLISESEATQ